MPYVWGGESPEVGFDCSGLVVYCARLLGIELPHYAKYIYNMCQPVDIPEVGDLVFFHDTYPIPDWELPPHISHMGIYAGNGEFLNANGERGVCYSALTSPYWQSYYYGAARLAF